MRIAFVLFALAAFSLAFLPSCQAKGNLVVYWGQDSAGTSHPNNLEQDLGTVCTRPGYDIIIIAFLISFVDSRNGNLPDLNLANHCETAFPQYPFLLNCPEIGKDIIKCQQAGKKVLLSLGGAAGSYGFTSTQQAQTFAGTVWNMFLGNTSSTLPRPFGNASLDGVDLDIEGGSPTGYGAFVTSLRSIMNSDSRKKYLITAAPQCPWPDYYVGPSSSTALGQAPTAFDLLHVQFYNNYCGYNGGSANLLASFKQWSDWSTSVKGPKIVLGLPASTTASNSAASWVPLANLQTLIGQLNSNYPSTFGGVMLWDASWDQINVINGQTYGSNVAKLL